MLNPQADSKSPLSSRIALPVALMLAGIFGLGVATIQPTVITGAINPEAPPAPVTDAPESSAELATAEPEQADPARAEEDLVAFCSRHVTERRSFVVFKRGTCVVITEPCQDPMAEAKRILARCKHADARFLTEPTTDGDMIVTFKEPVFLRFSPTELAKMQPWLRESAGTLMTPDESVAAGEGWLPPENARVGLLARRRMLEDATHVWPVKVIRAKQRAIAAN